MFTLTHHSSLNNPCVVHLIAAVDRRFPAE